MSLVDASDDDTFVAEVSLDMMERSKAMQTHTTAMLKEYLQRRISQVQHAAEADFAHERETLTAAHACVESKLQNRTNQLHEARTELTRAQALIKYNAARAAAMHCFDHWMRVAERGHAYRARVARESNERTMLLMWRCYFRWALHVSRRCHVSAATQAKESVAAAMELKSRLAAMEQTLKEERARQMSLQSQLVMTLQRGVSAFSHEAGQVLKRTQALAADEQVDDDGTSFNSLQDVIFRHTSSSGDHRMNMEDNTNTNNNHRSSNGQNDNATVNGHATGVCHSTICPVHHRDKAGNVYHKCYAPHAAGGCACLSHEEEQRQQQVDEKHSMPRTGRGVSGAPHVPFVVTIDAKASRNARPGVAPPSSTHTPTSLSWRAREHERVTAVGVPNRRRC